MKPVILWQGVFALTKQGSDDNFSMNKLRQRGAIGLTACGKLLLS
jgi:hypothetical protein